MLDSIGTMREVLELCGLADGAKALTAILHKAQTLCDTARTKPGQTHCGAARKHIHSCAINTLRTTGTHSTARMGGDEFKSLTLYAAVCEFERRFKACVGDFNIESGKVVVLSAERGEGWNEARRQHYQQIQEALKQYTKARNVLFHNADKDGQLDLEVVLSTMGRIVAWLESFAPSSPQSSTKFTTCKCASDWHHHTNVQKGLGQTGAQVDVRVELTMSPHRMEIPIPPDRCFCGRETSVKDVTDALLAREGARVLITGVAGMGKDALAAAVLRSERVSSN